MPPISGFPDPPTADIGPEALPLTDAEYDLWSVDLEDIHVDHVREVWVQTLRGQGDSHVDGRWLFRPQRWLEVGPATIDATAVDLSYGGLPLATGVDGTLLATIHPFDVRQYVGLEFFNHVSADARLRGRTMTANTMRSLKLSSDVAFSRGEGPIDGRLVLDHGRIAPGTLVRTETPDSEVAIAGLAIVAPLSVQLGVDGDVAKLDGGASDVRVSRLGVEQARAASVAATLTSRHRDIEHFFDDAAFVLDVGGAASNDIGLWKHLLPSASTFDLRSAAVSSEAHAEGFISDLRGRGSLQFLARRVSLSRGQFGVTADIAADIQLPEVSLGERRFDSDGSSVVVANTVATLKRASVRVRTVTLRASSAEIRAGSGSASAAAAIAIDDIAVGANGGVRVATAPSLTMSAPRLVVAPSGLTGSLAIDLPRLDLLALRGLGDILPLPRTLELQDGRGRARMHAVVDLGTGAVRGDGDLSVRGVRARVAKTQLFGDLDGIGARSAHSRRRGMDRSVGQHPCYQARRDRGRRTIRRAGMVGERRSSRRDAANPGWGAVRRDDPCRRQGRLAGDGTRGDEHGGSPLGRRPLSDARPRFRR